MPKSHELVEKTKFRDEENSLTFDQIHQKLAQQAVEVLKAFLEDQNLVINYFKVTLVCLVPDAIDCLI